jgi:hypothetical protein
VINWNDLFGELIHLLFGDLLPSSQEPLNEPFSCQPNSINTLASSRSTAITSSHLRLGLPRCCFPLRHFNQNSHTLHLITLITRRLNYQHYSQHPNYRNMQECHIKLRLEHSITKNIFNRCLYIKKNLKSWCLLTHREGIFYQCQTTGQLKINASTDNVR